MARQSHGEPLPGLAETVSGGEVRASLEAVRDRLAADLQSCDERNSAAIAKQLVDVIARLEGLPRPEGSGVDELRAKRAKRLGAAKVPDRAAGGK